MTRDTGSTPDLNRIDRPPANERRSRRGWILFGLYLLAGFSIFIQFWVNSEVSHAALDQVDSTVSENKPVAIQTPKKLKVSGRVVDETGKPVPGAKLSFKHPEYLKGTKLFDTTRTGRFECVFDPGVYMLTIAKPGYKTKIISPLSLSSNRLMKIVLSKSYERPTPVITPPPVPPNKYRLRGFVVNRSGDPVRDIYATVSNPSTGFVETASSETGRFSVFVPRGSYYVVIRDQNDFQSSYSNIVVNSNTSVKFAHGSYKEPPTPSPPTPEPPSPEPPSPEPPTPEPPTPEPPTPEPTTPERPTPETTMPTASPDEDDDYESGFLSNTNTENANVDFNSEDNSNKVIASISGKRKDGGDNGKRKKPSGLSTLAKVAISLLVIGVLAGLIWTGLPVAAAAGTWIAGSLGGLGMAGTTATDDDVKCTLYSAPEVNAGSDLLVQVFAHLLEQEDDLDELAGELDPDARNQRSKSLKRRIKRDSVLTFKLMIPGIDLVEDEEDLVWRGEPDSVEFIVPIPADHGDAKKFGRVFVYQNGEELGKIPFRFATVSTSHPIAPQSVEPAVAGVMTQNETAFVSYSSRDKDQVYRFVQLMDVLKYDYHIDVFHIDAGERWEQKLYKFIDTDDVFLLFWSDAASKSEWVVREAKRAEERTKTDPKQLPKIIIYRLDNDIPIPEWLQQFHVDRKWAGIIDNVDSQGRRMDSAQ